MADALSRNEGEQEITKSSQLLISDGIYYALTPITSIFLDTLRNEVLQNP